MEKQHKKTLAFFFTGFIHGGGERVTVDIARALQAEGCAVELVFLYSKEHYKKIPTGLPVVFLDAPRIFSGVSKLSRYLKERIPTTLLTTQEHAHVLALLAHSRAKSNTRIVLRFGLPPSQFFKHMKGFRDRYLLPFLAYMLYRRADAVIGNSQHTSGELVRYGIAQERIHTIHNPLPVRTDSDTVDHPWFEDSSIPIILALGRLEPQKDFQTLLKAFSRTVQEQPARLLILGDGSERTKLQDLASRLGMQEYVDIPGGYVDDPLAYMAHAHMFVLSSRYEGFPSVMIEALASGTAVVATDCISDPREILAPDTAYDARVHDKIDWAPYGVLVPVGDTKALAEALTRLLTDANLRTTYVSKAKERSAQFTIERILPSYKRALGV